MLDTGRIVAQGTPDELKRLVPGGHIRLEFGDAAELERAARILGDGSRDEEALALQIPNDGGDQSLRSLLDRLDAAAIDVDGLAVQTADLDDVFLSLTGDHQHDVKVCCHDDRLPSPLPTPPRCCAATSGGCAAIRR